MRPRRTLVRPFARRPLAVVLALLALGGVSLAQDQKSPDKSQDKSPEKKTGFIGIQMDAVALEGSPAVSAIRVAALVPGSPAEAAGILQGDLVLALDGEDFGGVDVKEVVNVFRSRLKPHGPGEKVRLLVARDRVAVESGLGAEAPDKKVGSGPGWSEVLPDLRALLEKNMGKVVTISAERARWTRELAVTLIERPGTRTTPLPENRTLRPDLERAELAPEASFARALIARAGRDAEYQELLRRLDEDERVEDPFRLATVRYLKRDPIRLSQATRVLGRALEPAGRGGGLRSFCDTALRYLDADAAPILTTAAPEPPPAHASPREHVDYCLALMRRARDLVAIALEKIAPDERAFLEKELPSLAAKFKDTVYLHEDEDQARWKRHSQAIDLLAKVNRGAFIQGLRELAPLSEPAYLDRLEADLKEAEGRSRGEFKDNNQGANGWVLYEGETELGPVVVGGSGPNGYRGDFALIIDLGGDDRYYRTAGGAHGRERPVAVSIDLAGDDRYQATEPFAQGAALMGVGLLVDRRGDDRYTTMESFAQGAAICGAAALVDLAGDDEYHGDAYAQGACLAQGTAVLLDLSGRDFYEAGLYSQAFAGPGGFGVLIDAAGDDRYVATGRKKCSYGEDGVFEACSQGSAWGFRGKSSGGIAALVDLAGNDRYEAGNFSQGGGYYYGWGALIDLGGGADRYFGSRYAQAFAAHSALGSLWDDGGDDRYTAWVGAAQSCAWDLSATAFVDEGGDDHYEGGFAFSQGASAHNGFALFYDASGADSYRIERGLPAAAGPNDYHGGPSVSVFIDAGGQPNVYPDLRDGVAFVPSRGIALSGEHSIFADLPASLSGIDSASLGKIWPGH
jgi:hypothetical protein